jgi:hypothetical protein
MRSKNGDRRGKVLKYDGKAMKDLNIDDVELYCYSDWMWANGGGLNI